MALQVNQQYNSVWEREGERRAAMSVNIRKEETEPICQEKETPSFLCVLFWFFFFFFQQEGADPSFVKTKALPDYRVGWSAEGAMKNRRKYPLFKIQRIGSPRKHGCLTCPKIIGVSCNTNRRNQFTLFQANEVLPLCKSASTSRIPLESLALTN